MTENKYRFLKMLQIEFEDLKFDVQELIRKSKIDVESGRISNYVFMENKALFENEISGISRSIEEIKTIDIDKYATLKELASGVEELLVKVYKEHSFYEAGHVFILRKIQKVKKYLLQTTSESTYLRKHIPTTSQARIFRGIGRSSCSYVDGQHGYMHR